MSTTYEINDRNEVIPYVSGRKCNDTTTWRQATELEIQQLDEINHINTSLSKLQESLDNTLNGIVELLDDAERYKSERNDAYAILERIATKGAFMDLEGLRLTVFDWIARRHIKVEMKQKMQKIMYALTKNAARKSYREFLDNLGITEDEYKEIKLIWKHKLQIEPYV